MLPHTILAYGLAVSRQVLRKSGILQETRRMYEEAGRPGKPQRPGVPMCEFWRSHGPTASVHTESFHAMCQTFSFEVCFLGDSYVKQIPDLI